MTPPSAATTVLTMRTRRLLAEGKAAHYHCMSRICGGELLLGDREKEVLTGMLWQVAEFSGNRKGVKRTG